MSRNIIFVFCILVLFSSCRRRAYSMYDESGYYEDDTVEVLYVSDDIQEVPKARTDQRQSNSSLEFPRLTSSLPEQILRRVGYTTSYNNQTKNANWVAWHLTAEHTEGAWKRNGIPYMVDDEVKGARQELEDWYDLDMELDHGHLCPAGDNKWSREAMEQTFLLTNMCPQNSALNRGDWEKLESRCRGWAKHYGEVYIAAGPIFYGPNYKTIGNNKVGVPDAFFKVVLRMGKKPAALGFIYPNDGTHHNMSDYVLTVDEIEEKSGIDFFYNLPDEIEDEIESHSELNKW